LGFSGFEKPKIAEVGLFPKNLFQDKSRRLFVQTIAVEVFGLREIFGVVPFEVLSVSDFTAVWLCLNTVG
ncbi:MAG: hypothetical protein B7Z16_08090, partial [Algoriphagus sp. 32-45-6]